MPNALAHKLQHRQNISSLIETDFGYQIFLSTGQPKHLQYLGPKGPTYPKLREQDRDIGSKWVEGGYANGELETCSMRTRGKIIG
jgi:hypothetical protein